MSRRSPVVLEAVEPRRLLAVSAVVANGTLTITGTDAAESIWATQRGTLFYCSGLPANTALSTTKFGKIVVNAKGGNDKIRLDDTSDGRTRITKPVTIDAGGGNDTVYGGYGPDSVLGQDGNDTLVGNDARDTLRGGNGADRLYGANESYSSGNAVGDNLNGDAGNDTLVASNGPSLLVGGADNDSLVGGAANDTLYGNDGQDKLYGKAGRDTVVGGRGADTVDGGTGLDLVTQYDRLAAVTDDASLSWNLPNVAAPEAWAGGYTGRGVLVAVIDTGLDLSLKSLAGRIYTNKKEIAGNHIDDDANGYVDDVNGWDFFNHDNTVTDDTGHGTAVASVLASARTPDVTGMAYAATILPLKIFQDDHDNGGLPAAIRYAVNAGAKVINLSLDGSVDAAEDSAIAYARGKNVLVVGSAGNAGNDVPTGYPASLSGKYDNVISVGASDSQDALADFSQKVNGTSAVQVDAPGEDVPAYFDADESGYFNGTSFSAPHVSGLAAMMFQAKPGISAATVRRYLTLGAAREISGSDSRGGVDAATSVWLAVHGEV